MRMEWIDKGDRWLPQKIDSIHVKIPGAEPEAYDHITTGVATNWPFWSLGRQHPGKENCLICHTMRKCPAMCLLIVEKQMVTTPRIITLLLLVTSAIDVCLYAMLLSTVKVTKYSKFLTEYCIKWYIVVGGGYDKSWFVVYNKLVAINFNTLHQNHHCPVKKILPKYWTLISYTL